jgi:hypothetical protein
VGRREEARERRRWENSMEVAISHRVEQEGIRTGLEASLLSSSPISKTKSSGPNGL